MERRARLVELAELSERLAGTRSRLERMRAIGDFLSGLAEEERADVARLLVGRPFSAADPRQLQISGTGLWRILERVIGRPIDLHGAADAPEAVGRAFIAAGGEGGGTLTVGGVVAALEAVASAGGSGSRGQREEVLERLFRQASPVEAAFLAKVILGDMRHGAGEGLVLEAAARATGRAPEVVRTAAMIVGDLGEVVRLAFSSAEPLPFRPRLFSPLTPMLAQTAASLEEAWQRVQGRAALEDKLDGARLQIHVKGETVKLFSRRLHDVTGSLPDVVKAVRREASAEPAIFEGEVIALGSKGQPRPFQDVLQRYGRIRQVEDTLRDVPVQLFLFDLLLDGEESLLAQPYAERWERLARRTSTLCVRRRIPENLDEARAFYRNSLHAGHEGVMIKHLDSPYTPGARGAQWLKLKRVQTLDLVIVAADWGYGRRHGWLSNYHLAARDERTGEYRPVGKTFKGLTDEEFRAMTVRLQRAQLRQEGGTVFVTPEVVVEVGYGDLQASRLYPDGMALRFARILRVRDDKAPAEADTLQTMRRLFEKQ